MTDASLNTDIDALLATLAAGLQEHMVSRTDYAMVGIQTGGAWIAERLHRELDNPFPLGTLNISFYRDDFSRKGLHPQVTPSQLPFSVDDRHLVLVDDVIMSGRTIRAAMNELFDYGRPASITLVTLYDIDARELPIQPDLCGQRLSLNSRERVKLAGPDPLRASIDLVADN